MMSAWGWMADAVLVLLLAGTLAMTARLDRALRVVRRDRAAFEALISNLGAATAAVRLGVQALRDEAERAAEQIEHRVGSADRMATDLSFLIEAADRAGGRLEQRLQATPAEAAEPPQASAAEEPAKPRRAKRATPPAETAVAVAVAVPVAVGPAAATVASQQVAAPGALRKFAVNLTARPRVGQPARSAGSDDGVVRMAG